MTTTNHNPSGRRSEEPSQQELDRTVGEYLRKKDAKHYAVLIEEAKALKSRDEASKAKEVKNLFKMGDKDKDGKISRQELEYMFSKLGDFTAEEFDKLFKQADTNADGELEYNEFVDWMFGAVEGKTGHRSSARVINIAADTSDRVWAANKEDCDSTDPSNIPVIEMTDPSLM